jgi:hypothetical protein
MVKTVSGVHRSIRPASISGLSISFALATATALSFLVLRYGGAIAEFHQTIVERVLVATGIPLAASSTPIRLWSFDVPVPGIVLADYSNRPGLMALTGACAASLIAGIYFRVRISRMLLSLLFALLGASFLNLVLGGGFGTDAGSFTLLWLRFEFVIWMLAPFIMALFAGIVLQASWWLAFWIVMPTLYSILWSACRLAFCLGILHLTGSLLAPMLWFTMGTLADVLYISLFYSVIAWHAGILRSAESS